MLSQRDRLNLREFGWANGMMNVAFIAGKMRRHSSTNPRLLLIQQTPSLEQSVPVLLSSPLSESAYPDGTYISIFARVAGRVVLDGAARPTDGVAVLNVLHVRYVEAREVSLDVAQGRLERALSVTNANARTSEIEPMDVEPPRELVAMGLEMGGDPPTRAEDHVSLLKGSNLIKLAGVIRFMEHRPAEEGASGRKGGSERVTLYLQQHGDLARAVPVRIYGRQAAAVVESYQPGAAIYVAGQLQVDVKTSTDGELHLTPYVKTHSVELAQPMVHIRTSPYPAWAKDLFALGATPTGFAQLTRRLRPKGEVDHVESALPAAEVVWDSTSETAPA